MGLSEKAFALLKKTPVKFVATLGEDGYPNVVPILSVTAWDKDTLCFVRFMVWKTRRNLEERKKVAVSALGLFRALEVLAEFTGFEKSGPRLDFFNSQAMYRYNAYFGAGQVGVLKVFAEKGWSKANPWRMLQAKIMPGMNNGHGPEVMPGAVSEKFRRALAAKYLAWIDEQGWPRLLPSPGAFPLSPRQMGIAGMSKLFQGFAPGKPLALSVLATEPTAYQVKGKFAGMQSMSGISLAVIELEKSFSAAPPLPGEQIYPRSA